MSVTIEHHCRWAGSESPRLLRSHLRDCDSATCGGCQPCPERHCRRCGKEHVTVDGRGSDQTCTPCIAETREDLVHCWITSDLLAEALEAGIQSEAAMLVGPAADPETWSRRHRLLVNAATPYLDDEKHPAQRALQAWMEDCRDERHPLWVLGTWEQLVREYLEQPADDDARLTGPAARDYLDRQLVRLAHDPEFPFEDLAREISSCRIHLEETARDSRRPETGAPCISCGRANLVKDYGKLADDQVKWACPKCEQWWDEETYRSKVAAVYVTQAEALTASQIAVVYRVPEATVRKWASRGHVRKRGFDDQRRQLYDVGDTLAKRDDASRSA